MTAEAVAPVDRAAPAGSGGADRAARAHLGVAALFLLAGTAAALLAALQLVWPDTLGGIAVLSYGRLAPAANTLLLLGWLAVGLFGAGYLVVGRSLGVPTWGGSVPLVSLALVAGGTAAGVVAVLLGGMEARELAELPLWADVIVAAGLLGGAFAATRTADPATNRDVPPAVWFALAGMWWTALAFVVANVPGLSGVNDEIQAAFGIGALLFGALPAIGLAGAYHVVSGLAASEPEDGGEPEDADDDPDSLARIGFWSLLFAAGWVGPGLLVHGPAPGWLETVGVAFAILYLLPVLVIVTDLVRRMEGRWAAAAGDTGAHFLALGVGLLPLLAVANVAGTLRASASVVGFTSWWDGFLALAMFGVLGSLLFGLVHVLHGLAGARWHFGLTAAGVALTVGALWAAGLQAGYTWVGTSNSGEAADVGLGFRNAVEPLAAWFEWRAAGLALLLAGALAFAAGLARRPGPGLELATPPAAGEPARDDEVGVPLSVAAAQPLRVAVQGAIGLFLVAALAVVVVPSLEEAHREASVLGVARDFPEGSVEERGREVYVQEGCVYCHTQQVRPVIADVGLGPVSQPGDYAELDAPLLGYRRLGPDLMHAGSREPTDSVRWVRDHLADPYRDRPWSIMPSYDYLSTEDLQALAQYVASLD